MLKQIKVLKYRHTWDETKWSVKQELTLPNKILTGFAKFIWGCQWLSRPYFVLWRRMPTYISMVPVQAYLATSYTQIKMLKLTNMDIQ